MKLFTLGTFLLSVLCHGFINKCSSNPTGVPDFALMTVEEPEDADADGLKIAMENSFEKLELTIDRKEHEIVLCSDGAAVNHSLFEKVKADIGDHYVKVWCPNHRVELAVRDFIFK